MSESTGTPSKPTEASIASTTTRDDRCGSGKANLATSSARGGGCRRSSFSSAFTRLWTCRALVALYLNRSMKRSVEAS